MCDPGFPHPASYDGSVTVSLDPPLRSIFGDGGRSGIFLGDSELRFVVLRIVNRVESGITDHHLERTFCISY